MPDSRCLCDLHHRRHALTSYILLCSSPRQVADHAITFFRTAKSRGEDIFAEFDESELEEEEEEEDEEKSNDDVVKFNQGAWTDEEARLFLVGLRKYGKGKWVQISSVVKTRYVITVLQFW